MFKNLIELYDLHENDEIFHDKFSYWVWSVIWDNALTQVVLRDELELSQTTFTRLLHRVKNAHFDKKQYAAIMMILTFYHQINCNTFVRFLETNFCNTKEMLKLDLKAKHIKTILDYWDDDVSFYKYFRDQLWNLFLEIKLYDKDFAIELEKHVSKSLRRNKVRFLYIMALLCSYSIEKNKIVHQKIRQFFVDVNNWPMHKGVYCDE